MICQLPLPTDDGTLGASRRAPKPKAQYLSMLRMSDGWKTEPPPPAVVLEFAVSKVVVVLTTKGTCSRRPIFQPSPRSIFELSCSISLSRSVALVVLEDSRYSTRVAKLFCGRVKSCPL